MGQKVDERAPMVTGHQDCRVMPKKSDTLTVKDNRTSNEYTVPIVNNAIPATAFKEMKAPPDEEYPANQTQNGLRVLDPGFQNTAVSESTTTYVDGQKGTIQYRGIDISELVGKVTFEDTAHLLIWGKLPTLEEKTKFRTELANVKAPSKEVFDVIRSFPRSAPPMTSIVAGLSALQGSYPEKIPAHQGKNLYLKNMKLVDQEIKELMANLSIICAISYCHYAGIEFNEPDPSLSYTENLLHMTGMGKEYNGKARSYYVSCIERLWALVADHEMTCSTAAFLHTASALPDPYSCMISACSAAYGVLHGGAIETAYRNIAEVGTKDKVPEKIEKVKSGKERLYGYGHRIYRVTDPRSVFIREVLRDLDDEVQQDEFLKIAFEIDRVACSDEYFTSRKLNPNADLFASFAYKAMGFPPEFILPLSLISRTQGFMAHWREAMSGGARIWRPQQIYTGELDARAGANVEE